MRVAGRTLIKNKPQGWGIQQPRPHSVFQPIHHIISKFFTIIRCEMRGAPSREPAAGLGDPATEAALRARRLAGIPPAHGVGVAPYEAEGAVEVPHAVVRGPRARVHLHVPPPEQGPRQTAVPAEGGGGTPCQ